MSAETQLERMRTENDFCSICLRTKSEVKLDTISNKVYKMFFVELVKCKEATVSTNICVWCRRRVVSTLKLVETAQKTDRILANIRQIDRPHCQSLKGIIWDQVQATKRTHCLIPRISQVTSYSLPTDTEIGLSVKLECEDRISSKKQSVSLDSVIKQAVLDQTQTTKDNHFLNSRISQVTPCGLPSDTEFGLSVKMKYEDDIPDEEGNICLGSVIDKVELNQISTTKETHVVVKLECEDGISSDEGNKSLDNVIIKGELDQIQATDKGCVTSRVASWNLPLDTAMALSMKLEPEDGITCQDSVINAHESECKDSVALESQNFLEIKLESEVNEELTSELDITENTPYVNEVRKKNKSKSNAVMKKTMKEMEFNKTAYTEISLEPINADGNSVSEVKHGDCREKVSKKRSKGGRSHDEVEVTDTNSETTYSSTDAHKHIHVITLTEAQRLEELERRRQKERYCNASFRCEPCVLIFAFRNSYEAHVERHSESFGSHKCSICGVRFEKMHSYQRHRRDHYKRYACTVCAHNYMRKQDVMDHYLSQHANERYKCQHCTNEFRTAPTLRLHIKTVHDVERPLFPCPHCSQILSTKPSYQRHVKRHNYNSLRPHRCEVCCRTYHTAARLHAHQARHSKEDVFCQLCGEQHKLLRTLQIHMKRKHSDVCFECDYCQKMFVEKNDLKEHILWKHLGRGYKCQLCPKVLHLKCQLKRHVQQMHGPKDKVCEVCGKGFSCNSALKSHHLVHSTERLYRCSICPNTFKDHYALKRHTRRVHKINNQT